MIQKIDPEEIARYLDTVPENTKIYLGCDSSKFKKRGKWFAEYCTVVVIHIGSNSGCKLFYEKIVEEDFDFDKRKPRLRLFNEVRKLADLYNKLEYTLMEFDVSIHIDINRDKKYASNIIIDEAIGYIKAMTGITPEVKPEAFAASIAADKMLA